MRGLKSEAIAERFKNNRGFKGMQEVVSPVWSEENLFIRRGLGNFIDPLVFPDSSLFNDMYYPPAPFLQTATDKPAVAAPGETLGAEDGATAPGCYSLQKFYSPEEIIGLHVDLVSSLLVSSQILSQKQVAQAVLTQGLRKGLSALHK
jgi:hypothetical protein